MNTNSICKCVYVLIAIPNRFHYKQEKMLSANAWSLTFTLLPGILTLFFFLTGIVSLNQLLLAIIAILD